jgi:hypothetical protein
MRSGGRSAYTTRVATYPPSIQMRVERSKVVGQRGRLGEEWADREGEAGGLEGDEGLSNIL